MGALPSVEQDQTPAAADRLAEARRLLEDGYLDDALELFGEALSLSGAILDAGEPSLTVMVAAALVMSLNDDAQSPAVYRFLRRVSPSVAGLVAVAYDQVDFTLGAQDYQAVADAVLIARAGALSAAGVHDLAIDQITEALLVRPSHLPLSHALFVARRRKAGLSDDLTGRFCATPFERFDVLTGGEVHLCCAAFMGDSAGNLYERGWEEVWNGAEAQAIRASIHDGSYRFCDKIKCPKFETGLVDLAQSDEAILAQSEPDEGAAPIDRTLAFARAEALDLPVGPYMVNLSFDRSCNLACPSCRTDFIVAKSGERDAMLALAETRIMPLLKTAGLVVVTGSGDPFASKTFRTIMRSLGPESYPGLGLKIMTNGVLFTPGEWDRIAHLHGTIQSVVISIDAAEPETYAVLRKGGDWDRLLDNLSFLGGLYAQGAFREFGLAFVVQAANWRQIPDFIALGRRVGAGVVRFAPIENWGTFPTEEYAAQAVQHPGHPEHEAFLALMASEALDDPIAEFGVLSVHRPAGGEAIRMAEPASGVR